MLDRKVLLAICVSASVGAGVFAQQTNASAKPAVPPPATATQDQAVPEGGMPAWIKPETPKQRHDRLGTQADPGINPDSKVQWWRYGRAYTIERYERRWAAYDREEGTVRPYAMVNFAWEIYQQNEKYVWVWMPVDQPQTQAAESEPPASSYTPYAIKFFEKTRSQFAPLAAAANDTVIRFEESSDGLPKQGSWRNSLDVADMNGDGFPDIVAPPQRGASGNGVPSIFLGDGKGHWKGWQESRWSHAVDYGSVVAADFNKDGKMDVALAVHLTGVYVFLGDGKGNFTDASEGLPHDFGSRRIITLDANGDGYPDLAAVSEGPTVSALGTRGHGKALLFLNKAGKGWEEVAIAKGDVRTGGDWMTAGRFNGDRTPDFLLASVYMGSWDVLFLSKSAKEWFPYPSDGDVVPSKAYYYSSAAGRFTSKTRDDAIISFIRFWPQDLDNRLVPTPPVTELVEIDRINFAGEKPVRTPIARWSGHEAVAGLAAADFNGDGKLDIIYTRYNPREAVILLGDGKGGFTRATVQGLTLEDLVGYDIKVADVNGDGRPDVILMYESGAKTAFASQDGSIRVFLNRASSKAAAANAATSK